MGNWKILMTPLVEKRVEAFLVANPGKAADVEGLLGDIQKYPYIPWATVDRATDRFFADRTMQIRFAGKAYPLKRTIVLIAFSIHV